ncbi:MAG: hypothetical protein AB1Z98_03135 [Nannocystaceae bacterium]
MRWSSLLLGGLLGGSSVVSSATEALAAEPFAAEPAVEREPIPAPAEAPRDAKREGPRRNSLVLRTHAKIPDWALSFAYHRALGRRFSVSGALEYGFQVPGYWHLQGVSETVGGQLWLGRVFNGVFAEASLTVAHQFLVRQPRMSSTALAPGIGLGFRWTHDSGLTLGASGGLRWGRTVAPSEFVCTRPKYCTSVRPGVYANITADIGFVF